MIVPRTTPARPAAAGAGTYDVPDLTRLLKLSERTVRRRYREGRIPGCLRVGGGRNVRFAKATVDAWITAGCPPA